jgi:hypothetical protein
VQALKSDELFIGLIGENPSFSETGPRPLGRGNLNQKETFSLLRKFSLLFYKENKKRLFYICYVKYPLNRRCFNVLVAG